MFKKHSGSLWADIKVYQDVAYVSNESSGGIDIIDLANVDSGVVSLVQRLTTGGISSAHNIAVDETSGFLYIVAGNTNGGRLIAFDLTDPRYPTFAGSQSNSPSFHDAQIITYTSGPYAGRQICFGFAGGSGLYIVDVTNKSNMFTVSQTNNPRSMSLPIIVPLSKYGKQLQRPLKFAELFSGYVS